MEGSDKKSLKERLKDLLSHIRKARVLVIGDIMLDRYIYGISERLSPEAPVPVVKVQEIKEMPGGAGNAAMNISALGGVPYIIGVVGDDEEGKRVKELLGARMGCFLPSEKRATTVKTRVISHSQHIVRFDREVTVPIEKTTEFEILERLKELRHRFNTVLVSDYGKGVVTRKLIDFLKKNFRRVIVDPFHRHFSFYRGCFLIIPNAREAEEMSGISTAEEEGCIKAGNKIMKTLGVKGVILKRGEKGMLLFHRNSMKKIPAILREVYDVAGAGDTVAGIISAGVEAGGKLYECALLASIGASIVVGKTGTATPSPEEILREIELSIK